MSDVRRLTFDYLCNVWGLNAIDCVRHQPTGVQLLYQLLPRLQASPHAAALLVIDAGRFVSVTNKIRVTLSKERRARSVPRTFELRFSLPMQLPLLLPNGTYHDCAISVVARVAGNKRTVGYASVKAYANLDPVAYRELVDAIGNFETGEESDD